MTRKDIGLVGKYRVQRTDGKPVRWAFVLEDTDPLAKVALLAYARVARQTGYEALAADLERKVAEMPLPRPTRAREP